MSTEPKGIIGETQENGLPVIYAFENVVPAEEVQNKLKWLLVISWKYDGSNNNGMPLSDVNNSMMELEDIIENLIANNSFIKHAYSRTGNNLKELVYYIADNDKFLEYFNEEASGKQKYPIEINFYKDEQWTELQGLLKDFK
ncbi:DUF695 domain-containing protein [Vibrio cyclitrophicus]|uniref:DUF695 domain-containing protein n=1 Tax=Vibrio cyclitrophicus TaxID=47951 RepID=UPI000CAF293F|nr:DUF695 domain-containing protein [Vibrio cyclitrophicus]PMF26210.1 hypothetical protein BCV18_10920 [Vibrio cyclitrophicus]PMF61579.1 hypothetical protein BCV12_20225 [Vibrio cyclitrophicus]PMH52100.1 hypothetical protein BCU67_10565 [Vibrio cyclitrophicus]PMO10352.1 hypothetical protein BCT18_02685 [Vibrio cyclitrophicus]